MERAEDVADNLLVIGGLLQPHEVLVDPVKVLPRLHEEVHQDFFHLFHGKKEFDVSTATEPPGSACGQKKLPQR